ncbi:MAG: hypothetical protein COA44_14630 [Arcobacter sp.]|nr:MAG: hypothetical protein COA44_14630 [Arcobacter sp.]
MIQFTALALLLGFELSYYLLIIQTGIAQHYHSDLFKLFPLFLGGVLGTISSGYDWGKITNPVHKIIIALSLQLAFSFLYPVYSSFTLGLLGLSVGMMAPLSIYLFKANQRKELFLALAIAYSVGSYGFTSFADSREWMALVFTGISLISALFLLPYKVEQDAKLRSFSFKMYLPLILWVFLDSNLFETLSRHESINIWSHFTYLIIAFHILGLITAFSLDLNERKQHLFISVLFVISYSLSYLESPLALAMVYPFAISYYNVIVFTALSKEISLQKLSIMMVFIGWIASGLGLALALSHLLH